jgi:putative ABC transport system permease protein
MMWLLRRLIERDLAESILGDFEECARQRYPRSPTRAALWTWLQLLGVVIAAIVERRPRASRWAADFYQDIGYATRVCRRNPGSSLAAVLTLSIGIGCTTAIFSIVNVLLLRSLPYEGADRLVRISERLPRDASGKAGATSAIEAAGVPELRAHSRTLAHVGIHASRTHTLVGQSDTVRIGGARVSPAIFEMLHAQPLLGRPFRADEETLGAEQPVVLSFAAWHKYFHADPDILSRHVLIDGESFSVVGVMREGFYFPDRQTEIWTPLVLGPVIGGRLPVLARLRDDVSLQTAQDEINAILSRVTPQSIPREAAVDGQPRFAVVQVQDAMSAPVRPALTTLTIAVGLVLLIACTNVANLLVARAAGRAREMSVRRALGAARLRLVRQVLTESVLLAVGGGIAGIVLAVGVIEVLQVIGVGLTRRDLGPSLSIPRLDEVRVDVFVLTFTLIVSAVAGVAFGLIPALAQSQSSAMDLLRSDSTRFGMSGRRPLQGVLIVGQLAMAMALLVAAGLQIHSFAKLSSIDPGYDPSRLLTFQVVFPDEAGSPAFAEDFVTEVQRLPGVRAVGYSTSLPMVQSGFISPISRTPGPPRPPTPGSSPTPEFPDTRSVSAGFLDALGVRIIAGRGLAPEGQTAGGREILVNRAFARTGYLGNDPVGQRLYAGERLVEVVGVIEDVRQFGLDQPADPQVVGLAFGGGGQLYYAVRTSESPASQVANIRHIVRRLAPGAGLYNVATMDQIVASSIGRRRFYAVLMAAFAVIAAMLAAVGVYGVVAYAVSCRTREIGIRIALGAHPRRVLGLIMRDAGVLVAIGVLLGIAGAIALTRSFDAMLFDLTPLDPATYAVVAIFFALVSLAAAFAAARHAATADPVVALRSD